MLCYGSSLQGEMVKHRAARGRQVSRLPDGTGPPHGGARLAIPNKSNSQRHPAATETHDVRRNEDQRPPSLSGAGGCGVELSQARRASSPAAAHPHRGPPDGHLTSPHRACLGPGMATHQRASSTMRRVAAHVSSSRLFPPVTTRQVPQGGRGGGTVMNCPAMTGQTCLVDVPVGFVDGLWQLPLTEASSPG